MKQREGKKKSLGSRWKFFLFVAACYVVAALIDPSLVGEAFSGFAGMALKIIPILGLVFCVLFVINLTLNPDRIRKHLGANSGLKGWFFAVIGGILVSGPPYILYPMLAEFKTHGVKDSLIAVFLYNRNVKIPFLPPLVYYFGLTYTVILSAYIILFSLISGILLEKILHQKIVKR